MVAYSHDNYYFRDWYLQKYINIVINHGAYFNIITININFVT